MQSAATGSGVRLTELLAALSLGVDLGMGHEMEHVLRQSLVALRLAERLGLDAADREDVCYVSLLAWVGCHVDAYEQAKWFGDDRAVKHDAREVDLGTARQNTSFTLRHLGGDRPVLARAATAAKLIGGGYADLDVMLDNHWRTADQLMDELGLRRSVRSGVSQTFERWDGRGIPEGLRGDQPMLPARLVNLADVVVVFERAGGAQSAIAVARERSGTQFDPALVELFAAEAETLFAELDGEPNWDALMAAEPQLERELSHAELDAALGAIADFVDLKSPYTIGHSRGVAQLARAAAQRAGMPDADLTTVYRAGLVHDLGRLGISNGTWDSHDRLTVAERERIRLHPFLSERMLAQCPPLAPLAALASLHHERQDGSGYPRRVSGDEVPMLGRILAAADLYRAKTEERPHRAAMTADEAAAHLVEEVRAGRIDALAADAVLHAAGSRSARLNVPAKLTPREVEVLRLVALGCSHREIAARLVISRKTASNHVEHIYTKLGVSNRAMASVYAMRQGLLGARGETYEPLQ